MKISLIALVLLFFGSHFSHAENRGHFYCAAYDLIRVEIMGSYSLENGHPLNDEFIVSIEDAGFFLDKTQVTEYKNERNSYGNHEFVLVAKKENESDPALHIKAENGMGTMSLVGWDVDMKKVPVSCSFTEL